MLVAALKERIQALPNNLFVSTWECIEAIEATLDKAGPTALLALNYVRAVQEKHLVDCLSMQQLRINKMAESAVNQHENFVKMMVDRNTLLNQVAKLEKKLTRLTKKTKRKA